MSAQNEQEIQGIIVESQPKGLFTVEVAGGGRVQAHASASLRLHVARLVPGDTVRVAVSPFDSSRGRITARVATVR